MRLFSPQCIACIVYDSTVMKRIVSTRFVILLGVTIVSLGFVQPVDACYQVDVPSVRLRSRSVTGTITLGGKPLGGATVSLHKFLGSYSVEADHADARPLVKATTTKSGTFTFGEVPSGKYVIIMHSPSSETTEVELVHPNARENDIIAIEFFADYCQRAVAITARGDRVSPSNPTIFSSSK